MADTSGQNLRDKHDAKNFFEISTTVEAQMEFLNKKVETKEDEEGKKTGPETPASKLKNAMARSLKLTKPRSKL
jgi:hypothetical protein